MSYREYLHISNRYQTIKLTTKLRLNLSPYGKFNIIQRKLYRKLASLLPPIVFLKDKLLSHFERQKGTAISVRNTYDLISESLPILKTRIQSPYTCIYISNIHFVPMLMLGEHNDVIIHYH